MKTITFLSSILTLFFLSVTPLHADSPNKMPKWLTYYYTAIGYYQSGVNQISQNPAAAIDTLNRGQEFARKSLAAGGAQYASSLSQQIGKALIVAKNNLKNPSPKPKPVSQPTARKKTPVTRISNNGKSTVVSR